MIPLAEKLRPQSLDEIVGQEHLVGPNGWIRRVIDQKKPLSILLWGPPGSGKTTIARLYAKNFDAQFISFSPIFQGVSDLKKTIQEKTHLPLFQQKPILFVDEIHRFNKAQQDAFLPFVEDGTIILVGATTENPSFALNNALLSRLQVLTLHPLTIQDLSKLIVRYETKYKPLPLTQEAKQLLLEYSSGDARHLFNMFESLQLIPNNTIVDIDHLQDFVTRRSPLYDKKDDGHYNLISALHKSIRGSDPDAALYWLSRMLIAGEDPYYILRRLIRTATEDIGLADPNALNITLHSAQAFERLGSPEGELAIAQATVYLALAPKSNSLYVAYKQAIAQAKKSSHLSPPKTILNAPTKLMKEEGYGKDYIYDHDREEGFSGQHYFPDQERFSFYIPKERGFEREMKKRLDYFQHLRCSQQEVK